MIILRGMIGWKVAQHVQLAHTPAVQGIVNVFHVLHYLHVLPTNTGLVALEIHLVAVQAVLHVEPMSTGLVALEIHLVAVQAVLHVEPMSTGLVALEHLVEPALLVVTAGIIQVHTELAAQALLLAPVQYVKAV
jgi:hypothetical protein